MFKRVVVLSVFFLFSIESLGHSVEPHKSACSEKIDRSAVAEMLVLLALFMTYHLAPQARNLPLLGMRTNTKNHVAAFLMMMSEGLLLARQFPSLTFELMASFMTPILIFGVGLNMNKALSRPISQNTAVRAGRMMVGIADFVLVPAYWYWRFNSCEDLTQQAS